MEKDSFEVIIVEDGSEEETKAILQQFEHLLNIHLMTNPAPVHSVGALRNQGLAHSTGEYILFLDDDTLILNDKFLVEICRRFKEMPTIDCIVIPGESDRCILKHSYSYLTRYSYGGAGVAYRRRILMALGGFFDRMISYEDIEFSLRLSATGGRTYREKELIYYHPPFLFTSWEKPISNGVAFLRMFKIYSKPIWFLCYVNALRFLPLIVMPVLRLRQLGKISGGFLMAPLMMLLIKMRKDRAKYV
jgi:glycosyltransferase involved in cell wall biosynthesis